MKKENRIYRWLMALWLLIIAGSVCSPVSAYKQATPPASWRTTPTLSGEMQPTYSFRSTSSFTPIVGATAYTAGGDYRPGSYTPVTMRKASPWDEPEGDEIGQVYTPVGEPYVLLLMALLYLLGVKIKKIREKFAYIEKKQ